MSLRTGLFRVVVGASFFLVTSQAALAQTAPANAPEPPNTAAPGAGPTVNGQSLTEATRNNSPVDQFGGRRQIAISSDAALTISNTSLSGVSGSTTQIMLQPAIDYFVIQNLSVGGSLLFNYSSTGAGHSTSFGIGPRVGYNIPISDLLSVWPKAGLSIARSSVSTDPTPAVPATGSVSNTAVALNLFVPLMLHPAPHFFAGFGPFLDTDLSGNSKATTLGGKLTIGGWL